MVKFDSRGIWKIASDIPIVKVIDSNGDYKHPLDHSLSRRPWKPLV